MSRNKIHLPWTSVEIFTVIPHETNSLKHGTLQHECVFLNSVAIITIKRLEWIGSIRKFNAKRISHLAKSLVLQKTAVKISQKLPKLHY